jgi:flagellar FliL protein
MAKDDSDASEAVDGESPPKKRFGKKFLLMAGGGLLVLLLAGGAGAYFFFFQASPEKHKTADAGATPLVPPQVVYYDLPDLIVNIQSADQTNVYLKLSLSLELATPEEKSGMQSLMPRIVDAFQGYLRELRVDDLRGSEGVMRLKEELLRRANAAADPYPVRDVLLKEMIIQ